jgi:acetylornithine deacetylase
MHHAVEFLQRLVQTESISGNEAQCVSIYADTARSHGFEPTVEGRNVWFERRVDDGPAILLNSHLDTVKAGPTWTRDPWDGAIEEGRLHGLGANDAKGCVAAQFGAAVELAESGFEGNIVVCASCDEEVGGEGMEIIAEDRLPSYDAALIGEPNNFTVALGQRGLIKCTMTVNGQRAHASRPWQGHNALHDAARLIQRLEADHLNVPDDLEKATIQVTLIEGGTQSNVVPDQVRLTVDCRTTPEFDNDAMVEHIRAAAEPFDVDFDFYSNRFLPVHTDPESDLVQAALKAVNQAQPTVFPSVCDLFWVRHVPALVMGPGKLERSHQADEFVMVSEVEEGVQQYASIVRNWWQKITT